VDIGVIVTIAGDVQPEAENGAAHRRGLSPSGTTSQILGSPVAFWDVVGQSVLDRTLSHLRRSGAERLSVIAEDTARQSAYSGASSDPSDPATTFWSAWDSVVSQYLNEGIDLLLLVRLGGYVELDLADLARFHRQNSSLLTQVCDAQGALDLVLVDATRLREGTGSFRGRLSAMIPSRRRYHFNGYSNRLATAADFRRLVRDALLGRCGIRPLGVELRPGIWIGSGARVESSAQIEAPAYIGAGARVRSASTIAGASSIERQSEIDCGTIVDGSCIFPGTYVGMGLRVTNALVAESRLFHLERNVEVEMDERLLGSTGSSYRLVSQDLMKRAASLIPRNNRTSNPDVSTRGSQMASLMSSLMTSLWLGRHG